MNGSASMRVSVRAAREGSGIFDFGISRFSIGKEMRGAAWRGWANGKRITHSAAKIANRKSRAEDRFLTCPENRFATCFRSAPTNLLQKRCDSETRVVFTASLLARSKTG